MNIGIIGSGDIGGTLGKLFAGRGHAVLFSSRHPEHLEGLAKEVGNGARTGTIEEVAKFGDVVVVSIPFQGYKGLPADALKGKIMIDTNNYYPDRDGQFSELDSGASTSSELLQRHLADSKVVKAFNTIWSKHLQSQGSLDLPEMGKRAIFVASDDQEAKATVNDLIHQIGFGVSDRGSLANGRHQQPGTDVYNKNLTVEEAKAFVS